MQDEVSVPAAAAPPPVHPPKGPEPEKAASRVVELPVTASASPSNREPRCNQLLRPSAHASIRGKRLYGACKSIRSQLLRAPRIQPVPPSGESNPLFSNAAETVFQGLRFSKLGDYVSEHRRNVFPLCMLVAANARFSAPAALSLPFSWISALALLAFCLSLPSDTSLW
ncbi:hypothetical protein DAEQUDRAFT_613437 [Daedalea quercina L-15889]|uniref:Uncharacterized protein n=1 Tax=Daedalea quercina L-15889 TaxID=1314783 RepID=A0A165LGU3_9APHY|nr:hypothetical protein DAEQUDRAFT_613437 [Daedalea quercina L-15889]